MYKVFTPFRRAFIQRLLMSDNHCVPAPKPAMLPSVDLTAAFDYPQQPVDSQLFPAGKKLPYSVAQFCREQVQDYRQYRDLPAVPGTSCLSPYLVLGSFHRVNALIACGRNPQKC